MRENDLNRSSKSFFVAFTFKITTQLYNFRLSNTLWIWRPLLAANRFNYLNWLWYTAPSIYAKSRLTTIIDSSANPRVQNSLSYTLSCFLNVIGSVEILRGRSNENIGMRPNVYGAYEKPTTRVWHRRLIIIRRTAMCLWVVNCRGIERGGDA